MNSLSELARELYALAINGFTADDFLPDDELPSVEDISSTPVKRCNQQNTPQKSIAQSPLISKERLLQEEQDKLEIGTTKLLKPYSAAVTPELKQKVVDLVNATTSFYKITDLLSPQRREWNLRKAKIIEELIRDHLSKNEAFLKDSDGVYNILKSLDDKVRKIIGESLKKEKWALIAMYRADVDATDLTEQELGKLYKECVEESKLSNQAQTLFNFFIDFSKTTGDVSTKERAEYKKNQLTFLINCLHFDIKMLTPRTQDELLSFIESGKLEVGLLTKEEKQSLQPLIDITGWIGGRIEFSQKKKLEEREQLSRDIGCPSIAFSELDAPTKKLYITALEKVPGRAIAFSRLDEYEKNQFVTLLKCCGIKGCQLDELSERARADFDQYGEINTIHPNAEHQLSKLICSLTLEDLSNSIEEEIRCENSIEIQSVLLEGETRPRYKISCLRFPSAYSIFLLLSDKKVGIIDGSKQYNGEKDFFLTKEQLDVVLKLLSTTKATVARYLDVMLDILGSKDFLSLGTKTVAEVRNEQNKNPQQQNRRIASQVLSGLSRDTKTPILLYTACSLDLSNHPDRDLIKKMLKGVYRTGGLTAFNGRIKEFQRDKPYTSNLSLKDLQTIEPLMNRLVTFINACVRNLEASTLTDGVSLLQDCGMTMLESTRNYQLQNIRDLLDSIGIVNKQATIDQLDDSIWKHLYSDITFDADLNQLRAPPGSDKRDPRILGSISRHLIERLAKAFGVSDPTIQNLMNTLHNEGVRDGCEKTNLATLIKFLEKNAKLGTKQLPLRSFPSFIEYVRDSHKYCTLEDLKELVEEFRLHWLETVIKQHLTWIVQNYTKPLFVAPVECYEPTPKEIATLYGTTQREVSPSLSKSTILALFNTLIELPEIKTIIERTPTIKMAIEALKEAFCSRIESEFYIQDIYSTNVYYSKKLVNSGFEYLENFAAKIKYREKSKVTVESIEDAFVELIALCSDGDLVNSCAQGFSGRLQSMLLRLNQAEGNDLRAYLDNFKRQCVDSGFEKTLQRFGEIGRNENSMFLSLKNDLYMQFGISSATQRNTMTASYYHGDFLKRAQSNILEQYTSQAVYDKAYTFICDKFKECNAQSAEDAEKDNELYKLFKFLGFGTQETELDKTYRINGDRELRWQFALFEDKLPSKLIPCLIRTQFLSKK